jgi:hypothetical protein
MRRKSETQQTELTVLYERFLGRQSPEMQERRAAVNRDRARKLRRLQKRGVFTVADLLEQLPRLPAGLTQFGIHLISILKIRQAAPVLLDMMSDRNVRPACASALDFLNSGRKVTQVFLEIARRELTSDSPDRDWLEAVIPRHRGQRPQIGPGLLVAPLRRSRRCHLLHQERSLAKPRRSGSLDEQYKARRMESRLTLGRLVC